MTNEKMKHHEKSNISFVKIKKVTSKNDLYCRLRGHPEMMSSYGRGGRMMTSSTKIFFDGYLAKFPVPAPEFTHFRVTMPLFQSVNADSLQISRKFPSGVKFMVLPEFWKHCKSEGLFKDALHKIYR